MMDHCVIFTLLLSKQDGHTNFLCFNSWAFVLSLLTPWKYVERFTRKRHEKESPKNMLQAATMA
jgi:hypothetical protein